MTFFQHYLRNLWRTAPVIHLILFFIFFVFFTKTDVNAQIDGVTSWIVDKQTSGSTNSVVPVYDDDGAILYYVELIPVLSLCNVRNPKGTIRLTIRDAAFVNCLNPTGIALFNNGLKVFFFCKDRTVYVIVTLSDFEAPFVEEVTTEETFVSSQTGPDPLLLKRGSKMETRMDAVLAVSRQSSTFCIGYYMPQRDSIKVCTDKGFIYDFYFLNWLPSTDTEPDAKMHVIAEVKTGAGIILNVYSLWNFKEGASPVWSKSLAFDAGSRVVHTNVNDADPTKPIIAYTQATAFSNVIKLSVYVVEIFASAQLGKVLDIPSADISSTFVSAAYIVKYSNEPLLIVQLPQFLLKINIANLDDPCVSGGCLQLATSSGIILKQTRDSKHSKAEWHRRLQSPSITDYNPYHLIEATQVQVIVSTNLSTVGISDWKVTSQLGLLWYSADLCESVDRLVTIGTLQPSLVYVGCDGSGRYTLVDLSAGKALYTINWPKISSGAFLPYGYISEGGSVLLSDGRGAVGFGVEPLLLYTASVVGQRRVPPTAAYSRGKFAIIDDDGLETNIRFSYYSLPTDDTVKGDAPLAPLTEHVVTVAKQAAGWFTVFFGEKKRLVAVVKQPGYVGVYLASTGAHRKDVNISGCMGDSGDVEAVTVKFLKSVQQFGFSDDYHVLLGGTSSCIFEVNDSLVPQVTRYAQYSQNHVYGTTLYSGYTYSSSTQLLQAFSHFFLDSFASVYTESGVNYYVVGSNVFVYVKENNIICRSVRSDIIVWEEKLPSVFNAPIVYMSYYNNTVFLVDQRSIFRYDVQYYSPDVFKKHLLFTATLSVKGESVLNATVGQGAVYLYTKASLYSYDAATGKRLWKKELTKDGSQGNVATLTVYSPEDTQASSVSDKGLAYIELRTKSKLRQGEQLTEIVDLYAQEDGMHAIRLLNAINDLEAPVIWRNMYNIFSSKRSGGLVSFRYFNLSHVPIPAWAKRDVSSISDVFVPGEQPINPLPPPLPHGDNMMAGSVPMKLFFKGIVALISPDASKAVVGSIDIDDTEKKIKVRCFDATKPQSAPVHVWEPFSQNELKKLKILEFNSKNFILMTATRFQFYDWSTCTPVGIERLLTATGSGLPSYISRPEKDEWIFLDGKSIQSLQPSTGKQRWESVVESCLNIHLEGNYIVCDEGGQVVVIKENDGSVVFQDSITGTITSVGSGFAGIAFADLSYEVVYYTPAEKLFSYAISITMSTDAPIGIVSGISNEDFVVIFKKSVISINIDVGAKSASVKWVTNLNEEVAESSAAIYVAGKANLVVGTKNGMVILDAATGDGLKTIFLKRRYEFGGSDRLPVMKTLTITSEKLYALTWNGYVVLLETSPGEAKALFAFGFGTTPVAQVSLSGNILFLSGGGMAGTTSVNDKFWGAPVSDSAIRKVNDSVFMSGLDIRNETLLNYYGVTEKGIHLSSPFFGEATISGAMQLGKLATFFGPRSINSFVGLDKTHMFYPLPKVCAGSKYMGSFPSNSLQGSAIIWYGGSTRDCIFFLDQQGSVPSFFGNLLESYISVENLQHGRTFVLLTNDKLKVIGNNGQPTASVTVSGAYYLSTLSDYTPFSGMLFVFTLDLVIKCYQENGLLEVWNYPIKAESRVPVTYYNYTVLVSTTKGLHSFTLRDFSYPCDDRSLLFVQPSSTDPTKTMYYSQAWVNEPYGIGYVTTYGIFYAFDVVTGKIIWERKDFLLILDAIVLHDGMLLVVSSSKNGIHFLNPFTGSSLLMFSTFESQASRLYYLPNENYFGIGGISSVVLNLSDYGEYFKDVKPDRERKENLIPYRPYSYSPDDTPNDCLPSAPPSEIVPAVPPEWISAFGYGIRRAKKTAIVILPNNDTGWAASFLETNVYVTRFERGTYMDSIRFTLEKTPEELNLYAESKYSAILGFKYGGETHYYNQAGNHKKTVNHAARSSNSVVLEGNGYFVNTNNKLDGFKFSNFEPLSSSSKAPTCKNDFDLVSFPKLQRIMLVCSKTGIMFVKHGSLRQVGATITGGNGENDFSMYDIDQELGVGVACGGGEKSDVYILAFKLDDEYSKIFHATAASKDKPFCGIRYPNYPSKTTPIFVFAHSGGYSTWDLSGKEGVGDKTQSFHFTAISTHGLIFYSGENYFFIQYGQTAPTLLYSGSAATGQITLRDTDGSRTTPLVIVYGNGFCFAVDTSVSFVQPLWAGANTIRYNNNVPFASAAPYVYTTDRYGQFMSFTLSDAFFSASGDFKVTVAIINTEERLFISRANAIYCYDAEGKLLWLKGISTTTNQILAFRPIVISDSKYALVSGGGRAAAIINKFSGDLVKKIHFEKCFISTNRRDSVVIVNGTMVYVTIAGGSCVHIVDLSIDMEKTVKVVQVFEIPGLTSPLLHGFPLLAEVEFANHFVFAAESKDPNDNERDFFVYRVDDHGKTWDYLWSSAISADVDTISTYGYFLYTAQKVVLNVFDLLTGKYAWGYIFDSVIAAPVIGADLQLYAVTAKRIYVMRAPLGVIWSERLLWNLSLPEPLTKLDTAPVGPFLSPYGQVIFSRMGGTIAVRHNSGGSKLEQSWYIDRSISRYFLGKVNDSTQVFLFDSNNGAGILDLSSGTMFTFSNMYSSGSLITGCISPRKYFIVCSFSMTVVTCRRVPEASLKTQHYLPIYNYEPQPIEKMPSDWVPSYPSGGSSGKTLKPTRYCRTLLDKYIPLHTACVNNILQSLYSEGRDVKIKCPDAFADMNGCHKMFGSIAGTCPDVAVALMAEWKNQSMDADSPLGLCDKQMAAKRCDTDVEDILDLTCAVVSMVLQTNGYKNLIGYSLDYDVPVFKYPRVPIKLLGPIMGSVFAFVVILLVAAVFAMYYYRKKNKMRDARFFDDDDVTASMIKDYGENGDHQMDPMSKNANVAGSEATTADLESMSLDTRSAMEQQQPLIKDDESEPRHGAAKRPPPLAAAPKKIIMKMPVKMPPEAKMMGPKRPSLSKNNKLPDKTVIPDDDI